MPPTLPFPNAEARNAPLVLETRGEGEPPVIRGHAAVFNSLSEDLGFGFGGSFRERILPGAFADVLQNDVRALFNHDPNIILARNGPGGTLELREDEHGLFYSFSPVPTEWGRTVVENIRAGLITQSSFAFMVERDGQEWEEDRDGNVTRTIKKFARLLDISPVTYPAYPAANDVAVRELRAFRERGSLEASRLERVRRLKRLELAMRGNP